MLQKSRLAWVTKAAALTLLTILFTACQPITAEGPHNQASSGGDLLTEIIAKDELRCGVTDSQTTLAFNSRLCQGLGVALGVGNVELIELSLVNRYAAVRGEGPEELRTEVNFRDSNPSAGREGSGQSVNFGPPIIYDAVYARSKLWGEGTDVAVPQSVEEIVALLNDLASDGVEPSEQVCTQGSSTLRADLLAAGISLEQLDESTNGREVSFPDPDRCETVVTISVLLAHMAEGTLADSPAASFGVLPFSPAVRDDEERLQDIVEYYVYGLQMAARYGVTKENIASVLDGSAPQSQVLEIQQLLGLVSSNDMTSGELLGLDAEWMVRAISEVGNYYEIWQETLTDEGGPHFDIRTFAGGLNQVFIDDDPATPESGFTGGIIAPFPSGPS